MQEEQIGEGILLISMQCLSICSPGSATLPFVHATQVSGTVMPVGTEHYDHSSLANTVGPSATPIVQKVARLTKPLPTWYSGRPLAGCPHPPGHLPWLCELSGAATRLEHPDPVPLSPPLQQTLEAELPKSPILVKAGLL